MLIEESYLGSRGTLEGARPVLSLQVIPRAGVDAYRLLRDKVTHEARTWSWKNKRKTRLIHKQNGAGYIDVDSADGVVIAEIHATHETDTYFFAEKFIGRLVAWFLPDLAAINVQFRETDAQATGRKKKKTSQR